MELTPRKPLGITTLAFAQVGGVGAHAAIPKGNEGGALFQRFFDPEGVMKTYISSMSLKLLQ